MFWCHQNTKGVLLKGIWGVQVCSGCSGCPGEKTKHQKASLQSRKSKKGVWVKSEHKRSSGVLLEVSFSKWNTKGVPILCYKYKFQNGTQRVFFCHQNTKSVLSKGIWGVRVCSGCLGCPGGKTKHQKASFHNRKLKKGVRVKSEHKRCSGVLLSKVILMATQLNTLCVPF